MGHAHKLEGKKQHLRSQVTASFFITDTQIPEDNVHEYENKYSFLYKCFHYATENRQKSNVCAGVSVHQDLVCSTKTFNPIRLNNIMQQPLNFSCTCFQSGNLDSDYSQLLTDTIRSL